MEQLSLFYPNSLDYLPPQNPVEYFFLIQPDKWIKNEVKLYKNRMHEQISLSNNNLWSVPHLSLFKIKIPQEEDETIIEIAKEALKGLMSFNVKLDGVDVYSHGKIRKSIVLKVQNPQPVTLINTSLRKTFQIKPKSILPHITIARAITADDFSRCTDSLCQFNLKNEFHCNRITILKKVIGRDKNYSTLCEVPLI